MTYTKTTWADTTKFTTTNLNNCETQYDLAYGGAVAHNHDTRYYTKTIMESTFWYAGNDGAGSGCDADLIYYVGGNKHYASFGTGGVNTYTIVMWETASPPSGWVICDGTNGTPNLTGEFVVGAGTLAVGASGGSNTWSQYYTITIAGHTLTTAELPSHTHSFQDDQSSADLTGRAGGDPAPYSVKTYTTRTTNATGGGGSHTHTNGWALQAAAENKPPCVVLNYIMKT